MELRSHITAMESTEAMAPMVSGVTPCLAKTRPADVTVDRHTRSAEAEADADIDALLDAEFAIEEKRQGYG